MTAILQDVKKGKVAPVYLFYGEEKYSLAVISTRIIDATVDESVKDFNFVPASTMGIMAREYEQQQFIALLQTLGPDSKIVPLVLKGIIENSSLSKREELMAEFAFELSAYEIYCSVGRCAKYGG